MGGIVYHSLQKSNKSFTINDKFESLTGLNMAKTNQNWTFFSFTGKIEFKNLVMSKKQLEKLLLE